MFEKKNQPVAPISKFMYRYFLFCCIWLVVISTALLIGAIGFHFTEGMTWLDATMNASMLLTTMGPVGPFQTSGGKLFAIFYSLFSGLIFVTAMGVVFSPIIHRILHKFHSTEL